MESTARPGHRTLVVADWAIDAEAVAVGCRAAGASELSLVVPAWLHGIDWVGDPLASVPCAERQIERITAQCGAAGLRVTRARVGDPDPLSAIGDAIADRAVDRILLFARGRHASPAYPFGVARRAARLSGVAVRSFAVPPAGRPRRRRRVAGGHCEPLPQIRVA